MIKSNHYSRRNKDATSGLMMYKNHIHIIAMKRFPYFLMRSGSACSYMLVSNLSNVFVLMDLGLAISFHR